jgi:hypothetical protein
MTQLFMDEPKLARIAWSVLAHGRSFEASKLAAAVTQPA